MQQSRTDAHLKLNTNFDEISIVALQDLSDFLYRWNFIPAQINVREWLAQDISIPAQVA